ncbi:RnfH family protein [Gallibacterium anatis]|uniref:RnfH family protein n=1 Tax=Gallibacterium anatis TaxID=750 RepID=UPI003D7B6E45
MVSNINVEIAYALPDHHFLKKIQVTAGSNLQAAILQSGVLQIYHDIDLRNNKVGIFGRLAKLTDIIQEGDRIEIYRPLLADPKEIRRKRAAEQAAQQQAKKAQTK